MSITIRLDWATCNFAPNEMSRAQVSKVLADGAIKWRQTGMNASSPYVSEMGLRWMDNNGFSPLPHKLEVSGVGCEHFSLMLPDLVANVEHRFSRLDFAFDVIVDRESWRQFIVKAFESSLNSTRQRKTYRLSGEGEAMTIYIGSRRCAKYFRIYNKTMQDKKYRYCVDGEEKEVPDGYFVIRYEVELKRYCTQREGKRCVFDPSPAFAWYFGSEEEQRRLCEEIRQMWLSFGDDVLLPQGFKDSEMQLLSQTNFYFVQQSYEDRLAEVTEKLHDYPHEFDHTLQYLVERFGKYIPYLISEPEYVQYCNEACEIAFGFIPSYYLEWDQPGWRDLDDEEECIAVPAYEIPWDGEQLCIENIEEGG